MTLASSGTSSVTMATNSSIDILARNVAITSGSGGIGSSTQALRIDATSITATTSGNADVYLNDVATGLTIAAGGLSAGTGTIHLIGGDFTSGGSNRISNSSTVEVKAAASLDLNGFDDSIGGLKLESATSTASLVATGAGTLTLLGNVTLTSTGTGATGATISGNLSLGAATRTFKRGKWLGRQRSDHQCCDFRYIRKCRFDKKRSRSVAAEWNQFLIQARQQSVPVRFGSPVEMPLPIPVMCLSLHRRHSIFDRAKRLEQ